MRSWLRRPEVAPAEVVARSGLVRGEKVLAAAPAADGSWLLGTRDVLVLVPAAPGEPRRIPWEQVERADWDRDTERLRVEEVGTYGEPRPSYAFTVTEPGLLLSLLRERVTASIVLHRRVEVGDGRGLAVIGRRAPSRSGEVLWSYEFDAGCDPDDPVVRAAAEAGLEEARGEVGPI